MPSKLRLRDWDAFYQRAAQMEDVGTEVTKALGAHVPTIASAVWSDSTVLKYATGPQDRMALSGSRVRASARSTRFTGATRSRLGDDWPAVEFGSTGQKVTTYTGRRGSTRFPVRRHTQRQLPARSRPGRVLFRYGKEAVRRVLSAYAQTIVRTIHETLDGRNT
ncbi:hypothetical protein [Promicromonospora sp. NPDC050880]|uniref:hypothetical protein n=1 Tax=Promicromonospora sp. NPDC050880 TaxID=3364406 RepID=UPI0037AD1E2F